MKLMTPEQAESMQRIHAVFTSQQRLQQVRKAIAKDVERLLHPEEEEVLPVIEPLYVEVASDDRAKPGAQTISGLALWSWREEEKAS